VGDQEARSKAISVSELIGGMKKGLDETMQNSLGKRREKEHLIHLLTSWGSRSKPESEQTGYI